MDMKSDWTESKRTEIVRWLAIAIRDRGLAGDAVRLGYLENAVYNFQQAAEKIINAFLFANDVIPKKTHSIDALIIAAAKIDTRFLDFEKVGVGSNRMTELATYYRYPNLDGDDHVQLEEIEGTVKFVDEMYKHLKDFFGEDVFADAVIHARQKTNHFEDAVSEIMVDDVFIKPKNSPKP